MKHLPKSTPTEILNDPYGFTDVYKRQSDYSFGYVAGWSSGRELSELKSSLETIRSAAAEIINSIDANLSLIHI